MSTKTKTHPPGVEAGVVRDFAKGAGKPGSLKEICKAWALTEKEAIALRKAHRAQITEQRQALSIACFELAGHAAAEVSKKLGDKRAMKQTPLRDIAMTVEKLTNAGVTAADGHKPAVTLNFGEIRMGRDMLAERDRKMREMKNAQEVTPC